MESSVSIRHLDDYLRIYPDSIQNTDEFWSEVAQTQVKWRHPWQKVSDCDFQSGRVRWFLGAGLNVAENCIDRHIEQGRGDRIALIWIGNEANEERVFTFHDLYREVCRVACGLEAMGVKKGDRVAFYLPNIPELAIGMLACARIGAIHSVIFGGFSAHAVFERINDCGAKILITATGTWRGKKWIHLKAEVDQSLEMGCPTIEKVVVIEHHANVVWKKAERDVRWTEVFHSGLPTHHQAPTHDSEDPLFILYTSGSTGKPKGVIHSMGGYLTYVAYSYETVFQTQAQDIHWCTADLGWITGHSYVVYGPLAKGITTVMFEGIPTYPSPSRYWEIVDRHQVSILYTAPTALRVLAAAGNEFVEAHSRASLRVLGSVGEPIHPETWNWFHQVVGQGRVPIVDTWWQTETGGILISPLAGLTPSPPGSAGLPLPGIEPILSQGSLLIGRSWPGQMTGVFGDPDRFYRTYFEQAPGFYSTGDGAYQDEQGLYWITGRTDDVIKVSGHRLGSAEIEAACNQHQSLVESAAIGIPDSITGEALEVFAVLRNQYSPSEDLKREIVRQVRQTVGPLATPQRVHWVPGLPKTRSGKIMRRVLRRMALGELENLGDLSTLSDPQIIDQIRESMARGE